MSKLSVSLVAGLAVLAIFLESRVAAKSDVLELLVVVDKSARDRWTALAGSRSKFQEELYSTFLEVNEVFKSLTDNKVNLEVRVKKVLTPDKVVLPSVSSGQVDGAAAMKEARAWVKTQKKAYDHVVVLTDAQLTSSGHVISGYTMIGATCSKDSVTVVKANYDYGTASILVKLLAQSMNVESDGQGDASSCNSNDGYVMTSGSRMSESSNRFSFSSCSAEQIKTYVTSKRCLKQTTAPSLSTRKRLGQVIGAEETCKRTTGKSVEPGYEEKICKYIHCLVRVENKMHYMQLVETPEGMSCGKGKFCIKGACVPMA